MTSLSSPQAQSAVSRERLGLLLGFVGMTIFGGTLPATRIAVSAIGYTFSGRLTAQMPGWEVISWALVIGLPISLPAAALTMPADLTQIAPKPWLAVLYVALFSQWIGFFAWNAGMALGGIAR